MDDAANSKHNDAGGYIYCKFIVRNGKVIYPKKAKVFRIPLSKLKKRKRK